MCVHCSFYNTSKEYNPLQIQAQNLKEWVQTSAIQVTVEQRNREQSLGKHTERSATAEIMHKDNGLQQVCKHIGNLSIHPVI